MRQLLFIALFCCSIVHACAQPSSGDGLLNKGFYMGYITSEDRSGIALYEQDPNDSSINFVIFSLKDFTQRRLVLPNVLAKPTPDLKALYWVEGLRNSNNDTAIPNFRLHYLPDGTAASGKVYDGPWFPFGFTADGKAIAADASLKDGSELLSAHNLRLIDPATGTGIKTLLPGSLLAPAESQLGGWGGQKYFWHVYNAKGALARVNKQTGETKIFRFDGKPVPDYKTDVFVGKQEDSLLLGGSMYNAATGSGHLKAFGFLSGRKLLDTNYTMRIFAAAWCFADGRLWAIDEGKGLTEYALTGGPLKIARVHPLDLSPVSFFAVTDPYQNMVVSKAANRVMLFPRWDNYGIPTNDGYVWELSSGKLLHKISNFYKGATYKAAVAPFNIAVAAAQEKAYWERTAAEAKAKAAAGPCGDAKAALKVTVGSWVREGKDGRLIQLLDYDCKLQRYTAEGRFVMGNAIKSSTFTINLFEVSSNMGNPKYRVVTASTCSKCNGSGTISGKRNYEKVDYGIYNKYTTTGTVSYTDLCGQCKGDGVVGR
jgi:hypothetical protein